MTNNPVQLHALTERQAIEYAVKAATSSALEFTRHALQRMMERGITRVQVARVIQQKSIVEGPFQDMQGRWNCRFEGDDAGDGMAVVVGFYVRKGVRVTVITTFELR